MSKKNKIFDYKYVVGILIGFIMFGSYNGYLNKGNFNSSVKNIYDKVIYDDNSAINFKKLDSLQSKEIDNADRKVDNLYINKLFFEEYSGKVINNLDDTLKVHINPNVRFIQDTVIPANTKLDKLDIFCGYDEKYTGGTIKIELFSKNGDKLTKYYEKTVKSTLGINTIKLNIDIAEESMVSISRSGYALVKYKPGNVANCYYSNSMDDTFDINSMSYYSFLLSMKIYYSDLNNNNSNNKSKSKSNNNSLSFSNIITVDKKKGDFTNIQDAINSITDDSEDNPYIIYVGQGTFPRFSMRSSVTGINRMRYISIIGLNKYSSIIKDTSGNYVTGSCDVWTKGTIENLTIEMSHEDEVWESDSRKSYALHFDFGQCDTEVRNCILISHQAPAVGIGLYQGTKIKLKDCELYSYATSDYGKLVDYGAIFCHSNTSDNITDQNIILENCKVVSQNGNKVAWFRKLGNGGEMMVESINTMYYSHKEGVGAKVENNAKLSPYSYGNNASNMNN